MTRTYAELVDLVQQSVPCTCHPAYTERDLVAPDCAWHHGAEVALEELRDAGALVGVFPRFTYDAETYASTAPAFGQTEGERQVQLVEQVWMPPGSAFVTSADEFIARSQPYADALAARAREFAPVMAEAFRRAAELSSADMSENAADHHSDTPGGST